MKIVKKIMRIKNNNKLTIIAFIITCTCFSINPTYASEIIVEDNFTEFNTDNVVSSLDESIVSDDTAQLNNESDTIDSEIEIEEDITSDEEIQEDTAEAYIEQDIPTITEDYPIYNTFSLRNTTTETESYINNNILEKDTVTIEDLESLRIDPYSINVGDEIIYYYLTDKRISYSKIISLNPLITYNYFYIDTTLNKINNLNYYYYWKTTFFENFIKNSDERIIFHKINNSDNVSIENATLSVDNTILETKVDRIENCIYLVIFATACCFGGICAKGFFDKL